MTQSKFLNILEGECKDIIEEPAIEFPFELDNFQRKLAGNADNASADDI